MCIPPIEVGAACMVLRFVTPFDGTPNRKQCRAARNMRCHNTKYDLQNFLFVVCRVFVKLARSSRSGRSRCTSRSRSPSTCSTQVRYHNTSEISFVFAFVVCRVFVQLACNSRPGRQQMHLPFPLNLLNNRNPWGTSVRFNFRLSHDVSRRD